jgi:hypothetical protein
VKRFLPLALQLALVALIAAGAGCKIPPKPMRFNNLIARGNEKLAAAAKAFKAAAVDPLDPHKKEGKAVDVSAARSAVNEADSTVTSLTKEFDAMGAPKHGDTMLSKYKEFLKSQRQIVDECMKPALKIIEDDKNYPTARDKWPEVVKLTTAATKLEQDAFKALDAAQSEYCERKENNFERKD